MQIIGQKSNLELIHSWDDMPQFIILQGDKNTGKTTLTLYLCERFNKQYVKMKNSVKDIRELIKLMTPNSNTVYHFKDFDKASIQAKNALLKITEEPIPGNYIVITGSTQIPTLESRARKLVMSAYSLEDMRESMSKHYPDLASQSKLYSAGLNTPSKVEIYSGYADLLSVMNLAYTTFDKLTNVNDIVLIETLSRFENRYEKLDVSILFLDMLIHIIESYLLKPSKLAKYDYYDILNVLIDAKEKMEKDYTLNRRFIIYRVFYTLRTMRGKI